MQTHQFVLSYWALRGTTQAVRNLLEYFELDYEDKVIEWPKDLQWSLKVMLDYPKMPNLTHQGFQVTEIVPMAKYICRAANHPDFLGKNFVDQVMIDVFINKIFKARKVYFESIASIDISDDVIFEKLMLQKLKGIEKSFLNEISNTLEKNEWYMGYLSLADFFLYNFLFYLQGFVPSIAIQGTLDQYMKRFESIEQLSKYFKSGRCNLPPTLSAETNLRWKGKRDYK